MWRGVVAEFVRPAARLRASRVPFRVRCNLRFGRLALFFFAGGKEGRRKRQSILNKKKKKTDRSTDGKHRENNEMNERETP